MAGEEGRWKLDVGGENGKVRGGEEGLEILSRVVD
jgi:hypothetical protein